MAEENVHAGSCACGRVIISVDKSVPAPLNAYCHCNDCTRHNMTPLVGIIGYPSTAIENGTIRIQGKEQLKGFQVTDRITRHFCSHCGSPCYMELHLAKSIGLYSRFIDSYPFKPTLHFYYQSKRLSVKDGVPKWKDSPAEFGGSGVLLED
eukprot:TRINITY_DN671_c0_g1_i1.p1 TRINITY_DN671_c0_g1~~TRINITY_DN671_c0_g1_i1.p1  ORF type:complete len:151 (+),score=20.75 TRINITY_DN671_c0_g1_i1:21-473(+)